MQNNVYECINISNVINKLNLEKVHQIGNNIYVKLIQSIIYIYVIIANQLELQ